MKNTNTKKFRNKVFNYLCLATYDFEGTQAEVAKHISDRFESEYNYSQNKQRHPRLQSRVAEWLSGLALSVDYNYLDILEVAARWHECAPTDFSEKESDVICGQWFNFLAFKLIQLWDENYCNPDKVES